MQVKYTIKHAGKTFYYPTMDEAIKMARFVWFPVGQIKEVHVY